MPNTKCRRCGDIVIQHTIAMRCSNIRTKYKLCIQCRGNAGNYDQERDCWQKFRQPIDGRLIAGFLLAHPEEDFELL